MVKGEKGAKLGDMSLFAPDHACGKRQKKGHATFAKIVADGSLGELIQVRTRQNKDKDSNKEMESLAPSALLGSRRNSYFEEVNFGNSYLSGLNFFVLTNASIFAFFNGCDKRSLMRKELPPSP